MRTVDEVKELLQSGDHEALFTHYTIESLLDACEASTERTGYLETTLRELHSAIEVQRQRLQTLLEEKPIESRTEEERRILNIVDGINNRMSHWQHGISSTLDGTYPVIQRANNPDPYAMIRVMERMATGTTGNDYNYRGVTFRTYAHVDGQWSAEIEISAGVAGLSAKTEELAVDRAHAHIDHILGPDNKTAESEGKPTMTKQDPKFVLHYTIDGNPGTTEFDLIYEALRRMCIDMELSGEEDEQGNLRGRFEPQQITQGDKVLIQGSELTQIYFNAPVDKGHRDLYLVTAERIILDRR